MDNDARESHVKQIGLVIKAVTSVAISIFTIKMKMLLFTKSHNQTPLTSIADYLCGQWSFLHPHYSPSKI